MVNGVYNPKKIKIKTPFDPSIYLVNLFSLSIGY
jgi:hypothetical protein